MSRLIFFIMVVLTITITGCTHSVDSPIGPLTKYPRTYSWTLDTLFYSPTPNGFGQTRMCDFWGLNDTLLYAVGHDANNGYGSMWRYDGKKWMRVHLTVDEGGPVKGGFFLRSIDGFAENDIYAFGSSFSNYTGRFVYTNIGLHYDGIKWNEIKMPKGNGLWSSTATSPPMVYCGGWNDGRLYHFDGINWSADTLTPIQHSEVGLNMRVFGNAKTPGVYIQTEQWGNGYLYRQIVKHDLNSSIILDSALNTFPWGGEAFWQSDIGNIYSCGTGGIFQLSGDQWKPFYSTDFIYSMFGSNEQHIFAVGVSNILFYDGKTWETLIPYIGTGSEVNVWCSETQVFISFCDARKTYILHGN